jgi:hypothetical protein
MQFSFTLDPSNFEILIVWTSISLSTVRIRSSFISIFGRKIGECRDNNLDLPTVYKRFFLYRDKSLWDLRHFAVTNLPYRVQWQDLENLFRRYGTPSRADVFPAPDGPDGRRRVAGMVSMRTRREAENCVNNLNGYEWFGRRIKVKIDETSGNYQTKHHPTQQLSFYDKHFLRRFPPLQH